MNIKNLEFEKSITRDWGIIYAQLWHKVFVEEFKKQIGWGYTEVVFEGKENAISIYRAPKEHIEGMRDFIMKQLDRDPYWLSNHAKKVKEQINLVIKWSNNIKNRSLNKYTSQELIIIAKTFMEKNIELGPRFIIMLWFPIQMENYNRTDKYKEAIDIAIKTRTDIEKIGPFADTFGRKLGLETAKRMDTPEKLSKYISYEEVLDYLKKGIIVDKKILEKRKKYFIITNKGILYKSIDAYLKKEGYNLEKEKLEGISEIKGQAAYLGLIKGTAKIIRNKEMFNKFKQGDVLVTGMTTPDFLPIMKKASAFITDEGGITCHASIVAREMKKPCIIGTKIATKVLKDGDFVEVDANSGVVRILGNKKKNNLGISIESYDWIYYLTRPFNLFGASLWHQWYADPQIMEIFGSSLKKGLYIENPKGSIRQYRERKEFQELMNAIEYLVLNNPRKCIKLLKEGFETNKKAVKNLEKNTFQNLKEAIAFVIELALLGALIPYFAPEILKKYKKKNNEIEKLSMKLREVSYYPPFIEEIIIPLTKLELKKLGVQNEKAINVITMYELLKGDVENIELRLRKIKENKCFIYERINKKENVEFVEDSSSIINDIEKISLDNVTEFKGNPAYKGKVIGRVKLILTNNPGKITFNKGDILVAISTNPNLLLFMKKASAILTDEGAIACHAAIISRELKIPCIIATKIGTRILKDGDLVEVDANKGIVKIIKRN